MVAAVNHPALMETRLLPQQAASVHPFQYLHPISASLHPLAWISRSLHHLLAKQHPILQLVNESGAAATAVMTPVPVNFASLVLRDKCFDWFCGVFIKGLSCDFCQTLDLMCFTYLTIFMNSCISVSFICNLRTNTFSYFY